MADIPLPRDRKNMYARIAAVDYYLPELELTNHEISLQFPEWSIEKIASKTGINTRHIAGENEFVSDLTTKAAQRLFAKHEIDPQSIDFVILCTQSPDYALPTTACIVQNKLGIPSTAGALDINLGCSGFIYGLGIAKGLIETGQASNVLLLTGDTYSKYLHPEDKNVRTIFGDGAAATLVSNNAAIPSITGLTYGSDGAGANHLIVPKGGLKSAGEEAPKADLEKRELSNTSYGLYMDGPEIFNFTIDVVPKTFNEILERTNNTIDSIDLFVFHQANQFMLGHLKKSLNIPDEKFFTFMAESGNTVSSTIPIALSEAIDNNSVSPGSKVMILGFGVGLSWGGAVINF